MVAFVCVCVCVCVWFSEVLWYYEGVFMIENPGNQRSAPLNFGQQRCKPSGSTLLSLAKTFAITLSERVRTHLPPSSLRRSIWRLMEAPAYPITTEDAPRPVYFHCGLVIMLSHYRITVLSPSPFISPAVPIFSLYPSRVAGPSGRAFYGVPSAAARLLRSWVRIPSRAWKSVENIVR